MIATNCIMINYISGEQLDDCSKLLAIQTQYYPPKINWHNALNLISETNYTNSTAIENERAIMMTTGRV